MLMMPGVPRGIVVFAHGSGSSRLSPRNQAVAAALNRASFGTLLFDLLTEEEAARRSNVFDISLLADRLTSVIVWLSGEHRQTPIGLFGASTGAAAALLASMRAPVKAVVSRGGRPDLVGSHLPTVAAPVLLIVGSRDQVVLDLNQTAAASMSGPCEIAVVPGAGHLFEEPGALEQVANLAAAWFERWLT
jgi:predicted alpha/beta-hydrolase family hydrolase